jgi:hypothetical protein
MLPLDPLPARHRVHNIHGELPAYGCLLVARGNRAMTTGIALLGSSLEPGPLPTSV